MNEGVEQLLRYLHELQIMQSTQGATVRDQKALEARITRVCDAIERGLLKS